MTQTPDWRRFVDHVMSIQERAYETWVSGVGWNNVTVFGAEYGENGVPWCAIFDWDMAHDVGLDSVVPKTDSVANFTDWAKARGQWSEYPSVGSWINFGDGAHTEICIGFDSTYVYSKGGNSIQAGAADGGQGNGVWSHRHVRTDPYVTGYFTPHFPDSICPPTANPHDPRGGAAVTEWRWSAPTPPPGPAPAPSVKDQVAAIEKTFATLTTQLTTLKKSVGL